MTDQIADADITSTAEKLAQFAQTLSEGEQAVLARVIALAAQAGRAGTEVQGYFTLIETPAALFTPNVLQATLRGTMGDGSVRYAAGGGGGAGKLPAVQNQPGGLLPAV
jgi:hypothetical protein